ncbi:outer envelope pore protein 24A, chloroplastic [Nymphaea colorata]|nr:outer envelope pore protein 24A, chloroplastic [Nymphaea colorata]XP_031494116.1 outer envelope pore protein 24A, chloroplastic [Nymphaea colorata]
MKAAVKGKYESHGRPASATLAVNVSNVKLKATVTDATFISGPSFNGLSLSVEKPGAFIIDYDVPRKDARFQFMNSIRVFEKPLNLTYIHARGSGFTTLEGSLVFDPANKLSTNYVFGSGHCKAKYTFSHGGGVRTFEPCYDLMNNTWDFAASHKVFGGDVIKASYHTPKKLVGLEWSRDSKEMGSFKIFTSFSLADELKFPKIVAETTWNFETS